MATIRHVKRMPGLSEVDRRLCCNAMRSSDELLLLTL